MQILVGSVGNLYRTIDGYDMQVAVYETYGMFANRFEVVKPTQHILSEDVIPAIFSAIEHADEVTQAHDNGTLSPKPGDSIRIYALKKAIAALHKLLTDNNITKEQFIGK